MKDTLNGLVAVRTTYSGLLSILLVVGFLAQLHTAVEAQEERSRPSQYIEENNQIRRDKFDIILPQAMRARGIDMWIHVMRVAIPDRFGAEDLGSTSGVFVFTDRGGDRIERAIIGRRWAPSQRERNRTDYTDPIEVLGAYDIVGEPVVYGEPISSPMTEYDYRFKGLGAFVEARNPERIAVNYRDHLGPWATAAGVARTDDGISHVDYRLLTEELGETYADRLVSSEHLIMDYNINPVPSEVELLKKMRADDLELKMGLLADIVPGVTTTLESGMTIFRRMRTGLSQRGRIEGLEDMVVQRGDILAAPSQGLFAYVLRDGETEPPADIQTLWAEKLTIDKIVAETIRPGLTPREIMKSLKQKLEDVGIIVRDPQLRAVHPNLFETLCFLKPVLGEWQDSEEDCWDNGSHVYTEGFDPENTVVTFDMHGVGKGARERRFETKAPRMGSYGPDWTFDVPLPSTHHFVIEYFFYMPSPADEGEDQYLAFWNHEQVIATASGVEYLSPPQQELLLIH
jgi:hypothetical protein